MTNSFSAALAALKEGLLVTCERWDNAFLALFAPHALDVGCIEDPGLKAAMTGAGAEIMDVGNVRLFDLSKGVVSNGWLPSVVDLFTDDWEIYDAKAADERVLRRRLQQAVTGLECTASQIVGLLVEHLETFGIPHAGYHAASSGVIELRLNDAYEGVALEVFDGGYSVRYGKEFSCAGRGSLAVEIADVVSAAGLEVAETVRSYHATTLVLELLSEDPVEEGVSLHAISDQLTDGTMVGRIRKGAQSALTGEQMADRLKEFGADPGLFGLSDEGSPT